MELFNSLTDIANKISPQTSCQGTVDLVLQEIAKNNLYGAVRLSVRPKNTDQLTRINKEGQTVVSNWHEAGLFEDSGIIYVIDPDSIKGAYTIDQYKKDCFPDPNKIELTYIEDT